MQISPLNSVNDTKRILALGHSKLYELIGEGTLAARKAGRKTLILGPSIEAYIASLPLAKIGQNRNAGGVTVERATEALA